jgi:hypothetical protein
LKLKLKLRFSITISGHAHFTEAYACNCFQKGTARISVLQHPGAVRYRRVITIKILLYIKINIHDEALNPFMGIQFSELSVALKEYHTF